MKSCQDNSLSSPSCVTPLGVGITAMATLDTVSECGFIKGWVRVRVRAKKKKVLAHNWLSAR